MTANRNKIPESLDVPGFVNESRPELEEIRSVSHRSERPLFFARYRHDKPNLGARTYAIGRSGYGLDRNAAPEADECVLRWPSHTEAAG